MTVIHTLLIAVQIIAALGIIGLVLLQQGKGADMGASFGGGASGSLFGATGSANFLSRSTAVCATVFFVATLGLALVSNKGVTTGGSSVLQGAPVAAPASAAAPVGVASGAAAIPGAAPAAVAPASVVAPAVSASAAQAPASLPGNK